MRELTNESKRPAVPVLQGVTRPVLVSALFFMVVAGIVYPLVTTGAAAILFPDQARGSLIQRSRQVVGSAVIGQYFTRPEYFHSRPSATTAPDPKDASKTVDAPYNAGASAASNQGVLSKKLLEAVAARSRSYRDENGLGQNAKIPVDAVTASASGLDPDISLANARLQVSRVAKARAMPTQDLLRLIDRQTTGRQLGVLGDPRINVVQLNLALDVAAHRRSAAQ
ncbi:K(+)-transporting ATPase subunit C [Sphingomonas sp. 10B4]|uniref:K(+)-transporting ATPase subunit C n=1 Tax=Sphingomonas sp. 10B4 TaxID=3048575 RepID=UPI002AB5278C|nr:K(+)-transporting ATPase subunit C [Sphingomonas sp. 10B4]MDY7524299.1 K(+)-transporting ATPase subunit C [Sphingomonas sp. 10B4]MEB0282235.1 K(+)-transporting ATPase subunit C [Sphingomonas sp. 10B4]